MKRPVGFDDTPEPPKDSISNDFERAVVTPLERSPKIERDEDAVLAPAVDLGLTPEQLVAEQSRRAKDALRALKLAQRDRRNRERGEQRRFTQWSRARRKRWLIGVSAVLGLAAFVGIGSLTPVLNLQKITVVGVQRLDPAVITQSLNTQLGTPLALIDETNIRNTLSEFSLIQEYAIEIVPPHELVVRIVERKPVLSIKRGETFDLVDPAGVVIETSESRVAGYPIADALVVDVNSPAFLAAAQSLAYMQPELAAQVDVASATTDQDVSFRLANGLTVVWGSSEQSLRKSILVNTMLTSLAGRPISVIDVSSTEAPVFS